MGRWAGAQWARALWAVAATLAAPGLRLLLQLRARRGKEIPERLKERRGIEPGHRLPGALLWLHAASVGETVSVLPVLTELAARSPELQVLLTTGTVTSAELLARLLPERGLAARVTHRFVPLDVPAWAARFLDHWRPDAACFVESELWPNLIAACRRRRIPLMLLNARLSPRSYAGWARAPLLARTTLEGFAAIRARSEADAARLRALGARAVTVPGDLKFAAPPLPVDAGELTRLRAWLAGRPAWLAASTHRGEDEVALDVHRALAPRYPGLLTILAPRHPERGAAIAALAEGLAVTRRASGQDPPSSAGVWIADTLGELGLLYRLAPIAFIGRSLGRRAGGQNPLEAARLGCAVAAGPHTGNFAEAYAVLAQAGALQRVDGVAQLGAWVDRLLGDPDERRRLGEAACGAAGRWAELPGESAAALLDLLDGKPG
ncbi:MAG: 3-deoxy-D-manno-octulosonic acid transferase [Acidisphaera sp.]|nr:3-deoxy-D-manno-octulosonic acid transferase [Acidisphaera sp.]